VVRVNKVKKVITIKGLECERVIYDEDGNEIEPVEVVNRLLPMLHKCPVCKGDGGFYSGFRKFISCWKCKGTGHIQAQYGGWVKDGVYLLDKGVYFLRVYSKDGMKEYKLDLRGCEDEDDDNKC